LHVKDTRVCV